MRPAAVNETPFVAGCARGCCKRGGGRGSVAVHVSYVGLSAAGLLQSRRRAGRHYTFGDGSGPPVAVRFTTRRPNARVLLDPELKLGEAYMDGTLVVEQGSIADVIAILLRPRRRSPRRIGRCRGSCATCFAACSNSTRASRSRHNVAHHYDLDGRLYSLFLDGDQQYSCAYFETPDQSLDDAQLAKKRHLAAKLRRQARRSACSTSAAAGAAWRSISPKSPARDVTGITLSQEQFARAQQPGASSAAAPQDTTSACMDYRDVDGPFDRIVSVGMFEHVGVGFYDTFFAKCAELLADDGVVLLHSIGRSRPPGVTNPWIAKYIFPGGYIPALSEVLPAIERAGSSSPTSRSCICIMPRRSRPGASASWRTARKPSGSTTSASCACGNSTSPARRWRSARATWWCSRSRSPNARTSTPTTRDYIAREEAPLARARSRPCGTVATRRRVVRRRALKRRRQERIDPSPMRVAVGNGESRSEDFPLRAARLSTERGCVNGVEGASVPLSLSDPRC